MKPQLVRPIALLLTFSLAQDPVFAVFVGADLVSARASVLDGGNGGIYGKRNGHNGQARGLPLRFTEQAVPPALSNFAQAGAGEVNPSAVRTWSLAADELEAAGAPKKVGVQGVEEALFTAEDYLRKKNEAEALNTITRLIHDYQIYQSLTDDEKASAYNRMQKIVMATRQNSGTIPVARAQIIIKLSSLYDEVGRGKEGLRLSEQALELLKPIAETHPSQYLLLSLEAYINNGVGYLKQWDVGNASHASLVRAAKSFTAVLAHAKKLPISQLREERVARALSMLGMIHYHSQFYDDKAPADLRKEAKNMFDQALKHDDDEPSALLMKAELLTSEGRAKEAIPLYDATLKRGKWGMVWNGKARARLQNHGWDEIADEFQQATNRDVLTDYIKGIQLKRRADVLWAVDPPRATVLYEEARQMWDRAFTTNILGGSVVSREDYANTTADMLQMEMRSGHFHEATKTVQVRVEAGLLKLRPFAARLAQDMPWESYADLALSLRSLIGKRAPDVSHFARLIDHELEQKGLSPENEPRVIVQRLAEAAERKQLAEENDWHAGALDAIHGSASGVTFSRQQLKTILNASNPVTEVRNLLRKTAAPDVEASARAVASRLSSYTKIKAEDARQKAKQDRLRDMANALKPIEVHVTVPVDPSTIAGSDRPKAVTPPSLLSSLTPDLALSSGEALLKPVPAAVISVPAPRPELQARITTLRQSLDHNLSSESLTDEERDLLSKLAGEDYEIVYDALQEKPNLFVNLATRLGTRNKLGEFVEQCWNLASTYQQLAMPAQEFLEADVHLKARVYLAFAERLSTAQPVAVPALNRLRIYTGLAWTEIQAANPQAAIDLGTRILEFYDRIQNAATGTMERPADISPSDWQAVRQRNKEWTKAMDQHVILAHGYRGFGYYDQHHFQEALADFELVEANGLERLIPQMQYLIRRGLAYTLYELHKNESIETVQPWETKALRQMEELHRGKIRTPGDLSMESLETLLRVRPLMRAEDFAGARDALLRRIASILTEIGVTSVPTDQAAVVFLQHADKVMAWLDQRREERYFVIEHLILIQRCATALQREEEKRAAEQLVARLESAPPSEMAEPRHPADDNPAITELQEEIRRHPGKGDSYFRLAEAYFEAERYTEAIVAYQHALRFAMKSQNFPTRLLPSVSLLWEEADAADIYEKLRQAKPAYELIRDQLIRKPGGLLSVVVLFTRLGLCYGHLMPERADAAEHARNYLTAAVWLAENRSSINVSTRLDLWIELSRVLGVIGNVSESLVYAQRAQALASQVASILHGEPHSAKNLSEEDLAELWRQKEASLDWLRVHEADGHFRMAWALCKLERWSEAIEHFKKTSGVNPSSQQNPVTRYLLAWAQYKLAVKASERTSVAEYQALSEAIGKIMADLTPGDPAPQLTGLMALTRAQEKIKEGLPQAALEGLATACSHVFELDAGAIAGNIDTLVAAMEAAAERVRKKFQASMHLLELAQELIRTTAQVLQTMNLSDSISRLNRAFETWAPAGLTPGPDEKSAHFLEAARTAVEERPKDPYALWQYARALEEEGRRLSKLGHNADAITAYRTAQVQFRDLGSQNIRNSTLSSSDRKIFEQLWNSPPSPDRIEQILHSPTDIERVRDALSSTGLALAGVVDISFHLGTHHLDLGQILEATDLAAARKEYQSGLALLAVAEVLSRHQSAVPVSDRVQLCASAGDLARRLNYVDKMFEYWTLGETLAADVDAHLQAGTKPEAVSANDFERLRAASIDKRNFFPAKESWMRVMAGAQYYRLDRWDEALREIERAWELDELRRADFLGNSKILVQTILARAKYERMMKTGERPNPDVLREIIGHCNQVLAANDVLGGDAYVVRALATARLHLLAGNTAASRTAAQDDLTAAINMYSPEPLSGIDATLQFLGDHPDDVRLSRGPLVQLLRLVADTADRNGSSALKDQATALSKKLAISGDEDPLARARQLYRESQAVPGQVDEAKLAEAKAELVGVMNSPPGAGAELIDELIDFIPQLYAPAEQMGMFDRLIAMSDEFIRTHPSWCGVYILNVKALIVCADALWESKDLPGTQAALKRADKYFEKLDEALKKQNLSLDRDQLLFRNRTEVRLQTFKGQLLIEQWKGLPVTRTPQLLTESIQRYSGALSALNKLPEEDSINVPEARSQANRGLAMAYYHRSTHETGKEETPWLAKADQAADAALADQPLETLSLWVKGEVARRRGDMAAARAYFSQAVEHNPLNYTQPNEGYVRVLLSSKEYDAAASLVTTCFSSGNPLRVIYATLVIVRRVLETGIAPTDHDRATLETWLTDLSALAGLPTFMGIGEDFRSFLQDLTVAFVKTGRVSDAITAVQGVIQQRLGLETLVEPLAEHLDLQGHQALASAIKPFLGQPEVTAFATSLANTLSDPTSASQDATVAAEIYEDMAGPEIVRQQEVEQAWKKVTLRTEGKELERSLFRLDAWKKLSPKRKIKLLLAWGDPTIVNRLSFLMLGASFSPREAAVRRFLQEVKAAVEASLKNPRLQLSIEDLRDVQKAFGSPLQMALNKKFDISVERNYTNTVGDIRSLNEILTRLLAAESEQILEAELNGYGQTLTAIGLKLEKDASVGLTDTDAQEVRTTLFAMEGSLKDLALRIPPDAKPRTLYDKTRTTLQRHMRRLESVQWLALQRQIAHLTNDSSDSDLSGIEKRITVLQGIGAAEPEPVDLPGTVVREFTARRVGVMRARWQALENDINALSDIPTMGQLAERRARVKALDAACAVFPSLAGARRAADQGIEAAEDRIAARRNAEEQEKLAHQKTTLKNLEDRLSAALARFREDTFPALRGTLDKFKASLTTAEENIAEAKRRKEMEPFELEWTTLEHRLGTGSSQEELKELEALANDLSQRSARYTELTGRIAGWPALYQNAQARVHRQAERAAYFDELVKHPVVQALLPKNLVPQSVDEIVYLLSAAINHPELDPLLQTHLVTWLRSENEAEWVAQGLDVEAGYSISQAVQALLRLKTGANGGGEDLGRRRRLAEQVRSGVLSHNNKTSPVRVVGTTPVVVSSFERVQLEFELADLSGGKPIVLRLGPGSGASVRVAVLLPVPPKGAFETQTAAVLQGTERAMRAAILIGFGYSSQDAWIVTQVHQEKRMNMNGYRLHELAKDDRTRVTNYRQARSTSDEEDYEAPARTLLAVTVAETESGRSLDPVLSAMSVIRTERPASRLSDDVLRQTMGTDFVMTKFDFIHRHLSAVLGDDATPEAFARAVQELGVLFDEAVARLVQPVAISGDPSTAADQLKRQLAPMELRHENLHARRHMQELERELERASQAARAAGVAGLISGLKTVLDVGGTLELAQAWIRDAEYVFADLSSQLPEDNMNLLHNSLMDIRQVMETGNFDSTWSTFYRHLGMLNHYLFNPSIQRWFWIDYDQGFVDFKGVYIDESRVVRWVPVGEDGFTFMLTTEPHEPAYRHGQRLAILSIPWLRERMTEEVTRRNLASEQEKWEFKRQFVKRVVWNQFAHAQDTLLIRSSGVPGMITPGSDLSRMNPNEAQLVELARIFRMTLGTHSVDALQRWLKQLYEEVKMNNDVARFAWRKIFAQFKVEPWKDRSIIRLMDYLRSTYDQGEFVEVRNQLRSVMAANVLLPTDLDNSVQDFINAAYDALELQTPPVRENRGEPSRPGRPGEPRILGRHG